MTQVAYLDASAAVKLIRDEPETEALQRRLGAEPRGVSSQLLAVELRCFVHRVAPRCRGRVAELIDRLAFLPLSDAVRTRAGHAFDPPQRALDAIHLATALDLDLADLLFLSYDERQLEGARNAGLAVASPSA